MKLKKKYWIRYLFQIVLFLLLLVGSYLAYRNYRILKQIHQYDTQVEAAEKEQGIPEYKDLALSIIFTETKGVGDDPMQSSESAHGQPNQITESDRSIEQGVSYLSEAIAKSNAANTDLWTAVQAYNFGLEYIDYVADNGGKNTLELAEKY
ncbi:MAG TPA: lysozyme family protein, partial [Enterococcus sp.]|nr:lysozyme family protein [Enterococcus sp.]